MIITFSRETGERKRECEEWAAMLKERIAQLQPKEAKPAEPTPEITAAQKYGTPAPPESAGLGDEGRAGNAGAEHLAVGGVLILQAASLSSPRMTLAASMTASTISAVAGAAAGIAILLEPGPHLLAGRGCRSGPGGPWRRR